MDERAIYDTLASLQRQVNSLGKTVERLATKEDSMGDSYGWVGGAWQKDPIRLGYSGPVERAITNTSLPAGASSQDDTPVPAGEIWVITNLAISYAGTVTGVIIYAQIVRGGTPYTLYGQNPPATGIFYDRQGYWVLAPGDNLRLAVTGATLNDDGFLRAVGFRVDIDQ